MTNTFDEVESNRIHMPNNVSPGYDEYRLSFCESNRPVIFIDSDIVFRRKLTAEVMFLSPLPIKGELWLRYTHCYGVILVRRAIRSLGLGD